MEAERELMAAPLVPDLCRAGERFARAGNGVGPCVASIAETEGEVRAAQRLRYRVFAEEMGAQLPSREAGLDCDLFDAYCDHLIVRTAESNKVVGTYRMLGFDEAKKVGGFYSATEFDMCRLAVLGSRVLEVGRACVDPDHRDGFVLALLWATLLDYIRGRGYEYVIGCGSISVAEASDIGVRVCNRVARERAAPEAWRVFPYHPFPLGAAALDAGTVPLPPLIKGYFRLGALSCGAPAWDPHFRTADFLLLLPVAQIHPRYRLGLERRSHRGRG